MNLDNHAVKAIIRHIQAEAIEKGEKHQPINVADGPSKKFIEGSYSRHPSLKKLSASFVDCDRINIANKETISQYYQLL